MPATERSSSVRRSLDWRWRRVSSPWRALPSFVILGAQRSGTTSLFDYLSRHPQIVPSFRKEVHFYDIHWRRGVGWYRANFPTRRSLRPGMLTGEATPNYLVHPDVPGRMREVTPEAKLIVMLRDPIERAHSAWRKRIKGQLETLSFEDAISRELSQPDLVDEDRSDLRAVSRTIRFLYLAKSRYADQLERWLAVFPRHQLCLLVSEETFLDPGGQLARLSDFLGIEVWATDSLPSLNTTDSSPIAPGFRSELVEYFRPHNLRLESMLGRRFDWD